MEPPQISSRSVGGHSQLNQYVLEQDLKQNVSHRYKADIKALKSQRGRRPKPDRKMDERYGAIPQKNIQIAVKRMKKCNRRTRSHWSCPVSNKTQNQSLNLGYKKKKNLGYITYE